MEPENQMNNAAVCESCRIDPGTNKKRDMPDRPRDEIVLYSTGCPRCAVLEKKLEQLGIEFEKNTNLDEMIALDMKTSPMLRMNDRLMDFAAAVEWLNNRNQEDHA